MALKTCGIDADRIWLEHDGGEIWIQKPGKFVVAVVNTRTASIEWQARRVAELGLSVTDLVKAAEEQAAY